MKANHARNPERPKLTVKFHPASEISRGFGDMTRKDLAKAKRLYRKVRIQELKAKACPPSE